ncbi:Capsid-binding 33 [Gossypium arboreum]|uniref:Capsid-binding 33 n=1 Tax=Gossypium arboreum TaxID=29729 RepID=A0A0B0PRX7_GOSAR|nr:Capsid-binding 33 [Gossypium arboreum]
MDQIEKMTRPKPCHTGNSHARVFRGLAITSHSRVTRACPCQAQVKSNSKKAIFKGF